MVQMASPIPGEPAFSRDGYAAPPMTSAASPTYQSMDEAVAAVRDTDSLGIPLGPGQPAAYLHALGERDYVDLEIFGALLVDLYAVFTRPGVRHLSGFFGPAERFLIASG